MQPEGVQRAYDTVARDYAEWIPDTRAESALDLAMVDEFIALVGDRPVLDAGCGAGRMSRYLADRGCSVEGIDLSPGMIDQAHTAHPEHLLVGFQAGSGARDVSTAYRVFGHDVVLERYPFSADQVSTWIAGVGGREMARLVRAPVAPETQAQAVVLGQLAGSEQERPDRGAHARCGSSRAEGDWARGAAPGGPDSVHENGWC